MNSFRARFPGTPALSWDDSLARAAAAQAQEQVAKAPFGGFYHSGQFPTLGGQSIGVNMHLGYSAGKSSLLQYYQEAVSNWDNEQSTYCSANPPPGKTGGLVFEAGSPNTLTPESAAFFERTGHFTQAVWRGTATVGCGHATRASDNSKYIVCDYQPAGNRRNTYDTNVSC
jgi:hypothetical protein